MKLQSALSFLLLLGGMHAGATAHPLAPQVVEFPSGKLHLKAYLWKPEGQGPFPAMLFNHGSGGETADLTAGMQITEAAQILAPFFIKHGYAFMYPFRRGQGLSADQAAFPRDLLKREEATKGISARRHLQFVLLTTEQLDDVMAAIAFLKTLPDIDSRRIAVAGHSFGGQLTLLAAERDPSIRAAVTFAAGAESWERSPEVRERLLMAARNTKASIMFTHAENDYNTSPGKAMAAELGGLGRSCVLKIYPPVGLTADDGHNLLYADIPAWESDVFEFLDNHVKH
jgi:dienelactone hydrolase